MPRFHLVPRNEKFFELFAKNAEIVLATAHTLSDVLESRDVQRNVKKLKDLEHDADEVTHAIFHALDKSFLSPFDREDIARLASAIDDVVDWLEEAGLRLHVFELEPRTELARGFGRVLLDQAECIKSVVPLLSELKRAEEIRRFVVELHRLENEADDMMVEALRTLYEGVSEVPELVRAVKWGDVYTVLEEATDKCEHVGTAIESIVVKYG